MFTILEIFLEPCSIAAQVNALIKSSFCITKSVSSRHDWYF